MDSEKKNKIKISTIIYSFLIIILGYIFFAGCSVYFFPKLTKNIIIKKTIQIIPYPVAFANYNFITATRLSENLDSVQRFYENQDFSSLGLRVDFKTAEGEKRLKIKEKQVLQKLIDDAVIESEAKKRNINLTKEIIDQEVDRKLKEYGTSSYLKENLQKLYDWDISDFKEKIVKPDLYKEKLFESIKKENKSYGIAKKKIEDIQEKLKNGSDISVLAKELSEGESAKNEGDLGWFTFDQMLPEVAVGVFFLEAGQTSEIIESSIGYHIVKVEDKKNEEGVDVVKLRQIFVRTESFSDWLIKKEKEYKIFILKNDYVWDNQQGEVIFKNKDMVKYETDLFKSETNDPSIIF